MTKYDSIFDTWHIKYMEYVFIVTDIYYATDKLVHFDYTNCFSVRFMKQLKKEMPAVV